MPNLRQVTSGSSNETTRDAEKVASWAKARLQERGWKARHIYDNGGPDRGTINRILKGKSVRRKSLELFCDALSAAPGFPRVDLSQVPLS
jgi:hypothetical protein